MPLAPLASSTVPEKRKSTMNRSMVSLIMPPKPTTTRGKEYIISSVNSFLSNVSLKSFHSLNKSARVMMLASNCDKNTYPMPMAGSYNPPRNEPVPASCAGLQSSRKNAASPTLMRILVNLISANFLGLPACLSLEKGSTESVSNATMAITHTTKSGCSLCCIMLASSWACGINKNENNRVVKSRLLKAVLKTFLSSSTWLKRK